MEEVSSLVTIGPGEEILFSMPVNHLGKRGTRKSRLNSSCQRGKGHATPLMAEFQ